MAAYAESLVKQRGEEGADDATISEIGNPCVVQKMGVMDIDKVKRIRKHQFAQALCQGWISTLSYLLAAPMRQIYLHLYMYICKHICIILH